MEHGLEEKSEKWDVQLEVNREGAKGDGSQIVTLDMKVYLEIELLGLESREEGILSLTPEISEGAVWMGGGLVLG